LLNLKRSTKDELELKEIHVVAGYTGFRRGDVCATNTDSQTNHIVEKRFSYEPSEITLKKGEPVILMLKSEDVTHGLAIEELGIKTEVKKGETEEVALTPTETGSFGGKCSHFCGRGHGSMTIKVNVVE